jgi:hypothetical protein
MSTQCVDGNSSEIPKNSASNVHIRSRLSHGYHGHFLGGDSPPDSPEMRRAASAKGSPKSQVSNLSAAEFKSEPLDLQARKLRGLFSLSQATACMIAALAFAGGPR